MLYNLENLIDYLCSKNKKYWYWFLIYSWNQTQQPMNFNFEGLKFTTPPYPISYSISSRCKFRAVCMKWIYPLPHPDIIEIMSKLNDTITTYLLRTFEPGTPNLEPISLGVIKNPGQLENRCDCSCGRPEGPYGDWPSVGSSLCRTTNRRATHGLHLYQVLLDRQLNLRDNYHAKAWRSYGS